MKMKSIQERYHTDSLFHNFVHAMYNAMEQLQLSPSEVREAAMFACVMYEQNRTFPRAILLPSEYVVTDGMPCGHKGCKNHVTEPCECCGRVQCRGNAFITK